MNGYGLCACTSNANVTALSPTSAIQWVLLNNIPAAPLLIER